MSNPRISLLVSALAAIAAGSLHFLSFQPAGWWWASPIAIALMLAILHNRPRGVQEDSSYRSADDSGGTVVKPNQRTDFGRWALLGFLYAASTALFSLPWIGSFVGTLPWVALSILLGLLAIPGALCAGYILRSPLPWVPRVFGAALTFVATEALLERWPFGGFPWLRLAWGQVGGPLAKLVTLGGTSMVSAAVVFAAAGLLALACRRFLIGFTTLIAMALFAFALPPVLAPMPSADKTIRVAAVQGNVPRLGLGFNAQRRAVLENHAEATEKLARDVVDGTEKQPDLVIWPENSSDVSPFRDQTAARIIDRAAQAIGVPIIVGTFSYNDGVQNTMVVWDPEQGPVDQHEKIYLQPFGETMPFRDLLRYVTDKVNLAGDMTPGKGDGVVEVPTDSGELPVGVATCYEVVFDKAFRDAVNNGATLLTTPTNNATFGFTDMTYQQLAMSRMRAMEFQRATVVAATSGVSAIVKPDGSVEKQSKIFEQKVLTSELPLHSHLTPAARYGGLVEGLLTILAILAVIAAIAATRGSHRGAQQSQPQLHA